MVYGDGKITLLPRFDLTINSSGSAYYVLGAYGLRMGEQNDSLVWRSAHAIKDSTMLLRFRRQFAKYSDYTVHVRMLAHSYG